MRRLEWVSLSNFTVLCTHQIDAAYWHEWEMFHLPGGNQINLILNLPLIGAGLLAMRRIVLSPDSATWGQAYLITLGLLVVILHTGFFVAGYAQFTQPMSYLLIAATGLLSIWQWQLVRAGRKTRATAC
ncbi:MAG: DUF6713 family protein [Abyssibacter sp.]|uniref:DUF6713 family protein n=1 Tax=Abyssibacter sp. TaxID=2320200 RepID=UPI00321C124C